MIIDVNQYQLSRLFLLRLCFTMILTEHVTCFDEVVCRNTETCSIFKTSYGNEIRMSSDTCSMHADLSKSSDSV